MLYTAARVIFTFILDWLELSPYMDQSTLIQIASLVAPLLPRKDSKIYPVFNLWPVLAQYIQQLPQILAHHIRLQGRIGQVFPFGFPA